MPAVKLFWYDGMKQQPDIPGVPAGELIGDLPSVPVPRGSAPPAETSPYVGDVFNYEKFLAVQKNPDARTPSSNGSLFVGDKGMLTTGTYGEDTRLIPVSRMADYKFPDKVLTRSPGHYNDWIRACKGGEQASSNFNVASPFVEWMLLGVAAIRSEGKLEYDPAKMRFTNNEGANKYLKPIVRKGWTWA